MTRSMWCSLRNGQPLLAVLGGGDVVAVARSCAVRTFRRFASSSTTRTFAMWGERGTMRGERMHVKSSPAP